MTPEVIDAILRAIRCGLHLEIASAIAGVSPSTVRSHRGRHRDFDAAVRKSEAMCEGSLVAVINRAANEDFRAAAWLLERSRPERWARPEIRATLTQVNISATDVVDGIAKMLEVLAQRHARFEEPDVEDVLGDSPPSPGDRLALPDSTITRT